jgi:hypothetical protein
MLPSLRVAVLVYAFSGSGYAREMAPKTPRWGHLPELSTMCNIARASLAWCTCGRVTSPSTLMIEAPLLTSAISSSESLLVLALLFVLLLLVFLLVLLLLLLVLAKAVIFG